MGTIIIFIRRSSLHIVNHSSIPTFVKRVQKGSEPLSSVAYSQTQPSADQSFSIFAAGNSEPEGRAQLTARAAQLWLTYISKHCPTMYKAHIGEFSKAIADERNARLVEVCLHALAAAATADAKLAPSDKCVEIALLGDIWMTRMLTANHRRTVDRVMRFVTEANFRHAKFAARLIACMKDADTLCGQVVEASLLSSLTHNGKVLIMSSVHCRCSGRSFCGEASGAYSGTCAALAACPRCV